MASELEVGSLKAGASSTQTTISNAGTLTVNANSGAGALVVSNADGSADIVNVESGKFVIDSSGNVAIGSGTAGRLLELSNATNPALRINNGNSTADIGVASSAGALLTGAADDDLVIARNGAYGISVGTNGNTRLTIDSSGLATFSAGILVNTTVTNPGNGNQNTGASITDLGRMHLSTTSSDHTVNRNSDGNLFEMRRSNSAVGSISVTTSATAYNTSSDYRLKENLTPLTGALDRLDQLPVYRFNFTADPDTTVDGFVAHEVSAHVPEAVTGEKDAMKTVVVQEAVEAQAATYYEEGDELPEGKVVGDEKTPAVEAVEEVTEEQPDYQGIDQSKLVPLLVAAVKELKAKVEALEGGE